MLGLKVNQEFLKFDKQIAEMRTKACEMCLISNFVA